MIQGRPGGGITDGDDSLPWSKVGGTPRFPDAQTPSGGKRVSFGGKPAERASQSGASATPRSSQTIDKDAVAKLKEDLDMIGGCAESTTISENSKKWLTGIAPFDWIVNKVTSWRADKATERYKDEQIRAKGFEPAAFKKEEKRMELEAKFNELQEKTKPITEKTGLTITDGRGPWYYQTKIKNIERDIVKMLADSNASLKDIDAQIKRLERNMAKFDDAVVEENEYMESRRKEHLLDAGEAMLHGIPVQEPRLPQHISRGNGAMGVAGALAWGIRF